MLVELSVMEQRYQAVLAVVQDGWKVIEVAGEPSDAARPSSDCRRLRLRHVCPRIEKVASRVFQEEAVLHLIDRIVAPLGLRCR